MTENKTFICVVRSGWDRQKRKDIAKSMCDYLTAYCLDETSFNDVQKALLHSINVNPEKTTPELCTVYVQVFSNVVFEFIFDLTKIS